MNQDKIKKLLRLAKDNANPHEAAAAMAAALKLAAGAPLPDTADEPVFAWSRVVPMKTAWQRKLAVIVCRVMGAKALVKTGDLRFSAQDAEACADIYMHLLGIAGKCSASFGHGVADALTTRLDVPGVTVQQEGLIPCRTPHEGLARWCAAQGPTRPVRTRRVRVNPEEYAAGRDVGSRAAFSGRRALCADS